MGTELNDDLIWCLRALAQDSNAQRDLYPDFVVVADELVLDFDYAYLRWKEESQSDQYDLEKLDSLIESKSGVLEYWTDEALDRSEFWSEIRRQATQALRIRKITTILPHPSANT